VEKFNPRILAAISPSPFPALVIFASHNSPHTFLLTTNHSTPRLNTLIASLSFKFDLQAYFNFLNIQIVFAFIDVLAKRPATAKFCYQNE
jgi:hypothetical protein